MYWWTQGAVYLWPCIWVDWKHNKYRCLRNIHRFLKLIPGDHSIQEHVLWRSVKSPLLTCKLYGMIKDVSSDHLRYSSNLNIPKGTFKLWLFGPSFTRKRIQNYSPNLQHPCCSSCQLSKDADLIGGDLHRRWSIFFAINMRNQTGPVLPFDLTDPKRPSNLFIVRKRRAWGSSHCSGPLSLGPLVKTQSTSNRSNPLTCGELNNTGHLAPPRPEGL